MVCHIYKETLLNISDKAYVYLDFNRVVSELTALGDCQLLLYVISKYCWNALS